MMAQQRMPYDMWQRGQQPTGGKVPPPNMQPSGQFAIVCQKLEYEVVQGILVHKIDHNSLHFMNSLFVSTARLAKHEV